MCVQVRLRVALASAVHRHARGDQRRWNYHDCDGRLHPVSGRLHVGEHDGRSRIHRWSHCNLAAGDRFCVVVRACRRRVWDCNLTGIVFVLFGFDVSDSCNLQDIGNSLAGIQQQRIEPAHRAQNSCPYNITNIVNCSLTSGQFHPIFKESVISPLHKNYRPVSNLSVISKIIEHVVNLNLASLITSLPANYLILTSLPTVNIIPLKLLCSTFTIISSMQ